MWQCVTLNLSAQRKTTRLHKFDLEGGGFFPRRPFLGGCYGKAPIIKSKRECSQRLESLKVGVNFIVKVKITRDCSIKGKHYSAGDIAEVIENSFAYKMGLYTPLEKDISIFFYYFCRNFLKNS